MSRRKHKKAQKTALRKMAEGVFAQSAFWKRMQRKPRPPIKPGTLLYEEFQYLDAETRTDSLRS